MDAKELLKRLKNIVKLSKEYEKQKEGKTELTEIYGYHRIEYMYRK